MWLEYIWCHIFSAYALGTYATPGDGSIMSSMLSAVGRCAEVPEDQMDAICGLVGSGPAYVSVVLSLLKDFTY